MRERHVLCPGCSTRLAIPPEVSDCVARCAKCQLRFRLPRRISVTDDAIADWLGGRHDPDADEDTSGPPQFPHFDEAAEPAHDVPVSGQTAVLPAVREALRIVKVDRTGVLFEFPAKRLADISFRAAMPKRCVQCGARAHVRPHPIVFTSQLRDSISLEAAHQAAELSLGESELRTLSREEIVQRMPRLPNVPHPADLAMPYYVCDMCSGSGTVSGQIQVNTVTGSGWCRLLIRSHQRAAEFCTAAGGENCREYDALQKRLAIGLESPWDSVSETIQHRLQQWYRPNDGEMFLGYLPDRDRARTEDGMNGVVITTGRVIYHTAVRHKEASHSEPLELQLAMAGLKGSIEIKTSTWDVRRLTVDRDGIEHFRRALAAGHFKATWK